MELHNCWCVQYMKADGTPAGRAEYFKTEERAKQYFDGCCRNGVRPRMFEMREVQK